MKAIGQLLACFSSNCYRKKLFDIQPDARAKLILVSGDEYSFLDQSLFFQVSIFLVAIFDCFVIISILFLLA